MERTKMTESSPRQQVERWIVDVCQHRRWTVREWAQMAGVPTDAIYRFQRGEHKTISRDNLAKLAEASTRPV
jgi:DNA-binding Xre family transcriptional regulator